MKLAKHTLLIDGNYFLHSRLFVLPRKKGTQLLGDHKSQSQLMRKLSIDFASELRKMAPFIDQVVVAVDAKSWRKDLFPDAQYKGTRTQDDSINWKGVFDVYTQWQELLAKQGVVIHRINGAEADDVIFGWSTQLNNEGKNCIVWTGDRDLIQLVNYNTAMDAYTLWYYNSKRKLITFDGFTDLLNNDAQDTLTNEDLLFDMSSTNAMGDKLVDDIKSWSDKNNVQFESVNCDEFIFSKILQGDKSDNIKSVVNWTKTAKSGRIMNYSISEKISFKVLDQFTAENGEFRIDMFFNQDYLDKIVDIIHKVVGKSTIEDIRTRFNQNLDLMLLHYNTIPEAIQNEIYKSIESDLDIKPNFKVLSKMESILEGTEWLEKKGDSAPSGYDPFAGLASTPNNSKKDNEKIEKLF